MAEVHKLIAALGRHGALQSAESDADRRAIEAAITYMSDEDAGVGFLYSGWCQAAMPHKKLANEAVWIGLPSLALFLLLRGIQRLWPAKAVAPPS